MKVPGRRAPPTPTPATLPPEYALAAAAHMNSIGKLFTAPDPTPPAPVPSDAPAP